MNTYLRRWPWLALFALAAVAEWAAQQVKTWAGSKLTEAPPPESPRA